MSEAAGGALLRQHGVLNCPNVNLSHFVFICMWGKLLQFIAVYIIHCEWI